MTATALPEPGTVLFRDEPTLLLDWRNVVRVVYVDPTFEDERPLRVERRIVTNQERCQPPDDPGLVAYAVPAADPVGVAVQLIFSYADAKGRRRRADC